MALKKIQSATLTGIVIPMEWNDDHDVTAAALATPDEKEYRIGGNRKGRELLGYLQHQVEARGPVSEDEKGRLVITVRSYIVKQT
jgi:hypothetical protein